MKMILKFRGFVGTVDNPTVVRRVCVGLRAELKTKVLDDIYRQLTEC